MALTPEDVVNKRFQSTKFREGYDQDEVDDFLDEIVVELRRLNQENDELRQRLVAADARLAETQRGGGTVAPMEAAAPAMVAAPVAPEPVPVAEAPASAPAPAAAAVAAESTTDTNNLLQLARRLHEEHVREGVAKKEQLIADGQAEATRLVTEATIAQETQMQALEQERDSLQQRVDELRIFEREYRQQLRTYIQTQLSELDSSAQPAEEPSASSEASSQSADSAPDSGSIPSFGSDPAFGTDQPFPGSAPSHPAPVTPAQGYAAPQTPPPSQFPGYGS